MPPRDQTRMSFTHRWSSRRSSLLPIHPDGSAMSGPLRTASVGKTEHSLPEYHELGKFFCDGVPIRQNSSRRKGTWDSGLSTKLRQLGSGEAEVSVEATIENSGLIHDKIVTLRQEVVNGDEAGGATTITIRSSTS